MDIARQMFEAAEIGNHQLICDLIDNKSGDPNLLGEDLNTPMHFAAANGHDNVVRALLARNADVDCQSMYNWTPLMQASAYGHLSCITLLIEQGAQFDKVNALGATAMICAARGGHTSAVHAMISAGASVNGASGSLTPLMSAAMAGHESVCRLLVESQADVNTQMAITGWSPLMFAAHSGYLSVVQLLVQHGADTNQVNSLDMTPMDIASSAKRTGVENFLSKKTDTMRSTIRRTMIRLDIFEATKRGNYETVKELVESNPDIVNQKDPDGATCLMFAAMRGQLAIAEFLIDHKAKVDAQDSISGWTALMQAVYYGHRSIARLLMDSGANVGITARNGCTAFDIASIIGDTDIVRLLATVSLRNPGMASDSIESITSVKGSSGSEDNIFGNSFESTNASFGRDKIFKDAVKVKSPLARWGLHKNRPTAAAPQRVIKPEIVASSDFNTENVSPTAKKNKRNRGQKKFSGHNKVQKSQVHNNQNIDTKPASQSLWAKVVDFCKRWRGSKGNRVTKKLLKSNKVAPDVQDNSNPSSSPIQVRKPTISTAGNTKTPPWRQGGGIFTEKESTTQNRKQPQESATIKTPQLQQPFQQIQNNVPPMAKLPAEILAPIKPPFMPPPAFELVHIERPKFARPSSRMSDTALPPMNPSSLSKMRTNFIKPRDGWVAGRRSISESSHKFPVRVPSDNGIRPLPTRTPSDISTKSRPNLSKRKSTGKHHVSFAPIRTLDTSDSGDSGDSDVLDRRKHGGWRRRHRGSISSAITDASSDDGPKPSSHSSSISSTRPITKDLKSILQRNELDHLYPTFAEQEVDLDTFLTLSAEDMMELGINDEPVQNQLLSIINIHRTQSSLLRAKFGLSPRTSPRNSPQRSKHSPSPSTRATLSPQRS